MYWYFSYFFMNTYVVDTRKKHLREIFFLFLHEHIYVMGTHKTHLREIFFLFLHVNICCEYSLEVPQWGTSNEYPQHMFFAGK